MAHYKIAKLCKWAPLYILAEDKFSQEKKKGLETLGFFEH